MAKFFGRYEHSLDVKGRVILPARFRAAFGTQGVVSRYWHQCLALWTPEAFEEQLEQTEAAQERSYRDMNRARLWGEGSAEVEIDRQGRLAIPGYLRHYAALDSEVWVIGAINRIELWSPAVWESRMSASLAELAEPEPSAALEPLGHAQGALSEE